MKAVRYHRYGGSDVLKYEEAERPAPGAGQVLVKVAGTAFNPVDIGIRAGALQKVFPLSFPHVPGFDVAGTMAELGEGVEGWQVGDAVVAFLPMNADAAAEYVLAPAEVLAAAPRTVELADAAALPSAGLTAWQALFELAGLRAGAEHPDQRRRRGGRRLRRPARRTGRGGRHRDRERAQRGPPPRPRRRPDHRLHRHACHRGGGQTVRRRAQPGDHVSRGDRGTGRPRRRRRGTGHHHHAASRQPWARDPHRTRLRPQQGRPAGRSCRPRRRRRAADRRRRSPPPGRPRRRPRRSRDRSSCRQDRPHSRLIPLPGKKPGRQLRSAIRTTMTVYAQSTARPAHPSSRRHQESATGSHEPR